MYITLTCEPGDDGYARAAIATSISRKLWVKVQFEEVDGSLTMVGPNTITPEEWDTRWRESGRKIEPVPLSRSFAWGSGGGYYGRDGHT